MLSSIAKLCCTAAAIIGPFASGGLVVASILGPGAGLADVVTAIIGWSVGIGGLFGFSALERGEDRRAARPSGVRG
jgi:sorbitol-specific phosphotransferase system component IIBC